MAKRSTKENIVADLRALLGEDGKPITQAELAKRAGVNQATISRAENDPSKIKGALAIVLRQLAAEAGGRVAA